VNYRNILKKIKNYYNSKILTYGPTPQGADWNSKHSQELRFEQLIKILDLRKANFTLNDFGCGYGALLFYLLCKSKKINNFKYIGYDICENMITTANSLLKQLKPQVPSKNFQFKTISSAQELKKANFTICSGVFNVKLDYTEKEWLKYIKNCLSSINSKSLQGFSFNMLTKYSDAHLIKNYLYYADPCFWFDYCKTRFSRNISLLHDYDLFEFTILVKK